MSEFYSKFQNFSWAPRYRSKSYHLPWDLSRTTSPPATLNWSQGPEGTCSISPLPAPSCTLLSAQDFLCLLLSCLVFKIHLKCYLFQKAIRGQQSDLDTSESTLNALHSNSCISAGSWRAFTRPYLIFYLQCLEKTLAQSWHIIGTGWFDD